jgi:predicted RNA-binding protein with PUA-like domain
MGSSPGEAFWLVKSEEDNYSLDDLERDGETDWTGVRNYEARNLMRDRMTPGDRVLYYHSNTAIPGVVGVARVVGEAYPDPTQFDPAGPYFDPKATSEAPRWWLVDLAFVERFPRKVSLQELKDRPELTGMVLLNRSRLSVQPVTREEFELVRELGGAS